MVPPIIAETQTNAGAHYIYSPIFKRLDGEVVITIATVQK